MNIDKQISESNILILNDEKEYSGINKASLKVKT